MTKNRWKTHRPDPFDASGPPEFRRRLHAAGPRAPKLCFSLAGLLHGVPSRLVRLRSNACTMSMKLGPAFRYQNKDRKETDDSSTHCGCWVCGVFIVPPLWSRILVPNLDL